jgi:hypothetical protein
MKKLYILFTGFFLSYTGSSQTCLPEGLLSPNQAIIDSFNILYPNCTQILGNVYLANNNLNNLQGLNGLTSIGGNVLIDYHQHLTSLNGLENLTYIGGDLQISEEYVLTNLSGLDNLSAIGGSLFIGANLALTSLTGLQGLRSVGGNLSISFNDVLISLSALDGLTSVGRYIGIDKNPALTSLTGLDNIDTTSLSGIVIHANPSLTSCAVASICKSLAGNRIIVQIYANANGCKDIYEVKAACDTLSVEKHTNRYLVSIFPNPANSHITVETTSAESQLSILNLYGQELSTSQITGPKTQFDISNLPEGVYFIRVTNNKTVEMRKIIKQ